MVPRVVGAAVMAGLTSCCQGPVLRTPRGSRLVDMVVLAESFVRANGFSDVEGDVGTFTIVSGDLWVVQTKLEEEVQQIKRIMALRKNSMEPLAYAVTWGGPGDDFEAGILFRPCEANRPSKPGFLQAGFAWTVLISAHGVATMRDLDLDARKADLILGVGAPDEDGKCAGPPALRPNWSAPRGPSRRQ